MAAKIRESKAIPAGCDAADGLGGDVSEPPIRCYTAVKLAAKGDDAALRWLRGRVSDVGDVLAVNQSGMEVG